MARTDLLIRINQQILRRSHRENAWRGPVAHAIYNAIGYQTQICELADRAYVGGLHYDYPPELVTWLAAYDAGGPGSTADFTLTLIV